MTLDGLAGDVTPAMVNGLLLARAPEILDQTVDENVTLFETMVRGAAVEIVPIVGTNPDEGPRRDLAARCIAYGAAADIEAALFPEQQGPGDLGRAAYLRKRYDELRVQLAELPADDVGAAPLSIAPTGDFPDPGEDPLDIIDRPVFWGYPSPWIW